MGKLAGKKVAMIIAAKNFRDEEFEVPRKTLASNGAKVVVASSSLKESRGMLGAKVKPDMLISDLDVNDYDCIVFVGGSGASEYWTNETALKIAKDAYDNGKIIAAICIAPVTLANAGILEDKKAISYPTVLGKLKAKGAITERENVAVDGNIVTADGPASAQQFADKIVEKLSTT